MNFQMYIRDSIGTNFYLTITDQLAAADKMTEAGQGMILGIQTYNTSVLGGIIAGLMVFWLYPKISKVKIPEALGFYSGPRLAPIAMLVICLLYTSKAVELAFTSAWSNSIDGVALFEMMTTISKNITIRYTNGKITMKLPKLKDWLYTVIEVLERTEPMGEEQTAS